MSDYKFDQDTTPSDGDVLTWNQTANRIRWTSSSPALASTIVKLGGGPKSVTPPAGSYIGGVGDLSGGGLTTVTMAEGEVYGPTDGTAISVSGTAGEYFIISRPV